MALGHGSSAHGGTAPGDRTFRPDVEGLRAVAVLLVVLFHAGVPGFSGGYVGVDVFFVISGFVITGVLLRERASTGGTSILEFYGRRCRRIIPAASLVIVTTVIIAFVVLGVSAGLRTATDGRWASVFLANFHFTAAGTAYFSAHQPPSPLQNYWSLAVEEQFYIVYPTLFVLLGRFRRRLPQGAALAIGLVIVIAVSFAWSVTQTSSNPTVAYFSPFTRAWELALGALVAVSTTWLRRLPRSAAAAVGWTGLAAIVAAGTLVLDPRSAYPGSLVAVPVVGAALVIAAGVAAPARGPELVLGLAPFRWVGRISYSLYLWHWPLLTIAAESQGHTQLHPPTSLLVLLVAAGLSWASFALVEDPIRRARFAIRRRWTSIGLGSALVAASLVVVSAQVDLASVAQASPSGLTATSSYAPAALADAIRSSSRTRRLPAALIPPLAALLPDIGVPQDAPCFPTKDQDSVPQCLYGDRRGTHTMVLYGDSRAAMWFRALDDLALRAHWRLITLTKSACPVGLVPLRAAQASCSRFQPFALARINRIKPDLLVLSQRYQRGFTYDASAWQQGMATFLRKLQVPLNHVVLLGSIPNVLPGPGCLVLHARDVAACAVPRPRHDFVDLAEQRAVAKTSARYVSVLPWFCSTVCPAVIGRNVVYWDTVHITATYSRRLETVLAGALGLPASAAAS